MKSLMICLVSVGSALIISGIWDTRAGHDIAIIVGGFPIAYACISKAFKRIGSGR